MAVNSFFLVWGAGACGFLISILCEFALKPRPPFARPPVCWLVQFGLYSIVYSVFTLLSGRVWCSVAATLAFLVILILVNNAKQASLREPFLFQDYDYFLDTIRFPRLFLPFLGIKSFSLCALGCLLALACVLLENPPQDRWAIDGLAGGSLLFLASGSLGLLWSSKHQPGISFIPQNDYLHLGFVAFIWTYGLESRQLPDASSPFTGCNISKPAFLPHLVAIQSESFFDPREMYSGIKKDILNNLDIFSEESFAHGLMEVPAWGANTVRTEFSFLTGIRATEMGVHAFSPYQTMARGWTPASLPAWLHKLGYYNICLHPYHGAFYGRKKIFPRIGFDEFRDIKSFSACPISGAYTGDIPLAEKVIENIRAAKKPVFIFVISMENHGPLQMETKPGQQEAVEYFEKQPSVDCPELGIYLRHLQHANQMLGLLHKAWNIFDERISLCFYGDHVPIMPVCYTHFGYPSGLVPWFCWNNYKTGNRKTININSGQLALTWLKGLNLF